MLIRFDNHQTTGWKNSRASTSRWSKFIQRSHRRIWANSCAKIASTAPGAIPLAMLAGRRISTLKNPLTMAVEISSTSPTLTDARTPSRRATWSAMVEIFTPAGNARRRNLTRAIRPSRL
jgi:hypothetical protein